MRRTGSFLLVMVAAWICLLEPAACATQSPTPQTHPTPQAQPSPKAQASPQAQATQSPKAPNTSASFVTDGGAGPCSAEFTVTGPDGKPVFAALINVHIAYGFGGIRKLDMGVYTNQEGKGKFTGIPAKVKKPPLEFQASKDQLVGVATVDPETDCQARHDIILDKPKGK